MPKPNQRAYIQDWNITSDTKFDGVRCEYVYMRLPTKENPDPLRKPDNNKEVFADGEFGDFIKPIIDTLPTQLLEKWRSLPLPSNASKLILPSKNGYESALKSGGIQALAQLLNHPAASFVIGALEDWQKTKDT
ncbi:hypothetical protein [Iningainema tapete]|uniref:hypothetical protein n=1 Tax=Iningainema tapete TaxID=2806730 RepID=UPI001EE2DCFF|nr:hypothetical protein [Iningainema tapete]